jgi:pimeloyl-ACP methyl ester carboxylesterase
MLPLARLLARRFTAYAPDLPGSGRSGSPAGAWGIAEMAHALGRWVDAVGLEAPIVVANSLGCQIVTQLAVTRPELVGPMVLIGPTVDPARRRVRHQVLGALRDSRDEPRSLVRLAAREGARPGIGPLVSVARAALADRMEDRLPAIEQPTVVVHGEEDGFLGCNWSARVAALLPHGRLLVVPAEAHAVHYTRPDLIAALVVELGLRVSVAGSSN